MKHEMGINFITVDWRTKMTYISAFALVIVSIGEMAIVE